MSSPSPIGGYFELELPRSQPWLHDSAILLNSGRSALEYLLRTLNPSLIHIPRFTCEELLEPIERSGTAVDFYSITSDLKIGDSLSLADGDLLLYTNYFGLMDSYCAELAEMYGNRLVLDFSQALFSSPPAGVHTFYSPRKFVGVPDGGCLYTNQILNTVPPQDVSCRRYTHLIGRRDLGPEDAFADFKANDATLVGEGVKKMSPSTEQLLSSINFDEVLEARRNNFAYLHRVLGAANLLTVDLSESCGPMVYPFLRDDSELRTKLLRNRVFVATYWPNVFEWCEESSSEWQLADKLIALPIDQRYDARDMERIINIICGPNEW